MRQQLYKFKNKYVYKNIKTGKYYSIYGADGSVNINKAMLFYKHEGSIFPNGVYVKVSYIQEIRNLKLKKLNENNL